MGIKRRLIWLGLGIFCCWLCAGCGKEAADVSGKMQMAVPGQEIIEASWESGVPDRMVMTEEVGDSSSDNMAEQVGNGKKQNMSESQAKAEQMKEDVFPPAELLPEESRNAVEAEQGTEENLLSAEEMVESGKNKEFQQTENISLSEDAEKKETLKVQEKEAETEAVSENSDEKKIQVPAGLQDERKDSVVMEQMESAGSMEGTEQVQGTESDAQSPVQNPSSEQGTAGHMHNIVTQVQEATCMTDGVKKEYCESCQRVLKEELVPALGHDYTKSVWELPTCQKGGYYNNICNRCGQVECVSQEPLPHEAEDVLIQEGNCMEDTVIQHVCKNCGVQVKEETRYTPYNVHAWITEVIDGVEITYCERCGVADTAFLK